MRRCRQLTGSVKFVSSVLSFFSRTRGEIEHTLMLSIMFLKLSSTMALVSAPAASSTLVPWQSLRGRYDEAVAMVYDEATVYGDAHV
eukprot:COSAG01_NODE_485_length_16397_cov_48.193827_9_plen_87_part_00